MLSIRVNVRAGSGFKVNVRLIVPVVLTGRQHVFLLVLTLCSTLPNLIESPSHKCKQGNHRQQTSPPVHNLLLAWITQWNVHHLAAAQSRCRTARAASPPLTHPAWPTLPQSNRSPQQTQQACPLSQQASRLQRPRLIQRPCPPAHNTNPCLSLSTHCSHDMKISHNP